MCFLKSTVDSWVAELPESDNEVDIQEVTFDCFLCVSCCREVGTVVDVHVEELDALEVLLDEELALVYNSKDSAIDDSRQPEEVASTGEVLAVNSLIRQVAVPEVVHEECTISYFLKSISILFCRLFQDESRKN